MKLSTENSGEPLFKTGLRSENSKSERWYTQDNCVGRRQAASKAPLFSSLRRRKWSRTTCPQRPCRVQCARNSTVEQVGSGRTGSSAPQEMLRYRRESPADSGRMHTRSRIGLEFPMTDKRLLRDARNRGRHRLVAYRCRTPTSWVPLSRAATHLHRR